MSDTPKVESSYPDLSLYTTVAQMVAYSPDTVSGLGVSLMILDGSLSLLQLSFAETTRKEYVVPLVRFTIVLD